MKYYPLVKEIPEKAYNSKRDYMLINFMYDVEYAGILLSLNNYNNNFSRVSKNQFLESIKTLKSYYPVLDNWEASPEAFHPKEVFNFRLKMNKIISDLYSTKKVNQDKHAEKYLLDNLEICKKNNLSHYTLANHLKNLGGFYKLNLKDHKKAVQYLTKAIEIAKNHPIIQNEPAYPSMLGDIAHSYWHLGEFEKGYPFSKLAVEISLKRLNKIIPTKHLLSDNYELEEAKKRMETHNKILFGMIFYSDQSINWDQKKFFEMASESFENGQLLPSLETAQAMSHLKVKIETNDDELMHYYKNNFLVLGYYNE